MRKRPFYYWAAAIVSLGIGWVAFRSVPKSLPELSRQEFLAELRAGHIAKVEIEDRENLIGNSSTRGPFRTTIRPVESGPLVQELRSLGVEVRFSSSGQGL